MLTGNVDVRQVNLAFEVPGRIASLEVEEGDSVHGGQILARIDTADLEDHVRLARASVDASEAVLDELEAGARPEEIDQARAAVAQAEAELRFAEATLSRLQELAERDVASHQLHDEAQARKDEAEAQLEGARQVLALLESGPRSETITQAAAKLTADRVTLSLAERSLGNAALSAPNDGVVLSRIREPGSIVGAGEPVYALALTSPVWVRSYIDEPDLGAVRPGMAVEVSTDSGHVYSGQIGFISPVAEFTPKTVQTRELRTSLVYRLRVIVDNPDQGLRQGMPVTVVLMLDEADEDAS
jgi:HlyD family secretion protein